jgi:hypothetical protein
MGMRAGAPGDLPPEAKAGETWCRVRVDGVYETVYERVQTVCPRTDCVWVPPVQKANVREVCVRPACAREIEMPAVYRDETYCRVVCPAHKETVRDGCCTREVEVPAVTETCTRRICIQAPVRKMVREPALYETRMETCEVAPGHWKNVEVPGVWEQVPRVVCKTEPRWEWRKMPCEAAPAAR